MSTADSLDFLPHQVNPDQVENEICSKYDNNFSVDYCYSYSDQTDRSYIIVFDTAENAVNVMKIYINACLNIWEFSRSTNVLVVTDSLSFVSATNYDYYVGTGSEDFPFLYM